MPSLRSLLLSAFVVGATCIQFEIPEVESIVANILAKNVEYVKFQGNDTNSTNVVSSRSTNLEDRAAPAYWYENINHQGISAFGPSGYQVFRNVKSYGAKGDGVTDDTAAINAAISDGGRCGQNCASTTKTPAVVYFPSGTYKISSSILDYYYTQLIGNPNNPPVLQATSDFSGFGLIDGDHYYTANLNWLATNVFYRQVRNFVIDMTLIPSGSAATGIHWPTAQATSLQNVVFQMSQASGTQHVGLFIEQGSGGFMTDLTFNGGLIGAHVGNQQFTMRNLVFNHCVSAITQLWSWGWVYQGLSINSCQTGIDISPLSASGDLLVGSVTVLDSTISNTPVGIVTAYTSTSQPASGGTLILENIKLTNVPTAIKSSRNGATVLAGTTGSTTIAGWGEGHKYTPTAGPVSFQGSFTPNTRPSSLLSGANYYIRSKPQYNNLATTSFKSVRSAGATGNGVTDDTTALQNIINSATAAGDIVYFDAGTYRITKTLTIPPGAKLVGEAYPVIMSSGSFFNNINSPQPVVQVGTPGQTGQVEWSDMIVSTQGTQAGAILISWNLATTVPGTPSGMWDVHARVGGFAGSNQQVGQCAKNPGSGTVNTGCIVAYMTMHITPSAAGLYMENNWLWTADHDMDDSNNGQITVYNGRGLYIESTAGNIWLVGTAVEHHTLYQYQFANTKNIYAGFIQTETPYYQPNPKAPTPFTVNSAYNDPSFSCTGQSGNCAEAWGLRVVNSQNVLIYGAGLYSFFNNYDTTCSNNPGPENCQTSILSLEEGLTNVNIYGLSTVGSTNMVVQNGQVLAKYSDNNDVYPDTIALFQGSFVPAGWNYLGCYADNPTARTLNNYITVPGGQPATTIQTCVAACAAQGYSLAGVEFGNECFCDNSFQNGGGPASDGSAQCNVACAGNSGEICGGNKRLDVYQSSTPSTPPSTNWKALGCYTDSTTARALNNYVIVPGGITTTTIENCQAACLAQGYTFAGVEDAHECFCDNKIQNQGPAASGCDLACSGNSAETCGGNLRVNIYEYSAWTYIGCYTDSTTARALNNYVIVPGGITTTTIENCQAACLAQGYDYAGVEDAHECFCDSKIQNQGPAASGCNMPCSGNAAETCGGNLRIDIYRNGSSSSAVTNPPPAKKWTLLGCYTDNTTTRTLVNYQSNAPAKLTVENCQSTCLAAGYSYAGVEYANECFCDNKIENGGALAPSGNSGCNIACAGNSAETCGGNQRINVYQYS